MKILIIVNNVHKWLWIPLAKKLVKSYNSKIYLITANQSLFEYYQANLNKCENKIILSKIPNIYDEMLIVFKY